MKDYNLKDEETGLYLMSIDFSFDNLQFEFSKNGVQAHYANFHCYLARAISLKIIGILDCEYKTISGREIYIKHSKELKEFLDRDVVLSPVFFGEDEPINLKSIAITEMRRLKKEELSDEEQNDYCSLVFHYGFVWDYFRGNYTPNKKYFIFENGNRGCVDSEDEFVMIKLSSKSKVKLLNTEDIIQTWKECLPDYLLNA